MNMYNLDFFSIIKIIKKHIRSYYFLKLPIVQNDVINWYILD